MVLFHCIWSLGGGGAERQLSYLAPSLIGQGHEVHVLFVQTGPNLKNLQNGDVILHQLSASSPLDPRLFFRIISTISKAKPDIVQTWLTHMDILGGLASTLLRIPFILSERSSSAICPDGWLGRLRARVGCYATAIVANSKQGLGSWQAYNDSALNRVIRNIVPISEIKGVSVAFPALEGIAENSELILFAGRFSVEKNISTLIDASKLLLSERSDAIVYLFGEGPLREQLDRQISDLGLQEKIYISGYITHECLYAVMKRADMVVSVSLFEGNPNVVLEAIAAGCPVVVSDIPAHREFLDDSMASFASPDSPEAIANAMISLLREPALAKSKAANAMQYISQRSLEAMTDEYVNLYQDVYSVRNLMKAKVD